MFGKGSVDLTERYNAEGSSPLHRLEAVGYGCVVVEVNGVGGEQVLGSDSSDCCLEGDNEVRIFKEAGGECSQVKDSTSCISQPCEERPRDLVPCCARNELEHEIPFLYLLEDLEGPCFVGCDVVYPVDAVVPVSLFDELQDLSGSLGLHVPSREPELHGDPLYPLCRVEDIG